MTRKETSIRVAIFAIALASSQPVAGIILRHDIAPGGSVVEDSAYPALFPLYISETGRRDCIATLIHANWAITAAHCANWQPMTQALNAGEGYAVQITGSHHRIDRVVLYPTWAGRSTAFSIDLALLHMSSPVVGVRPALLYAEGDEVGRLVITPGWGDHGTGRDGIEGNDHLLRVGQNIVDEADGMWLSWDLDDPEDVTGMVASLEGIAGAGDSGGPAFVETGAGLALLGISAYQRRHGLPAGSYGIEGVYARISGAAAWIAWAISVEDGRSEPK